MRRSSFSFPFCRLLSALHIAESQGVSSGRSLDRISRLHHVGERFADERAGAVLSLGRRPQQVAVWAATAR